MTFLKSAALVTALFPAAALAQAPATPAAAPEAAKVEAKLKPFALIEADTTLMDSTTGAAPFFQISEMRLGVRYTEGIAHGQTTWKLKKADDKIDFDVRDGFVGVTLPSGFTADFGRVRPKTVDAWGAFGTVGNSYGSMNAIHLGQTLNLGDANTEFHAYYGNNIQLFNGMPIYKTAYHVGYAGEKPIKAEKAFIVTAKATAMDSIKVALSYGAESKAVKKLPVAASGTTAAALGEVADVSMLSFSAGYDKDGITGGLWYNKIGMAKAETYAADSKADTIKTTKINGAETGDATVIGLGANIESTVFGVKDLFQTDDKLAFGASYEMFGFKEDEENYNYANLSVGYLVGKLDFELNFTQYTAKEKIYTDAKGKKVDSQNSLLLAAVMEL